jgi:hypothetical protein
VSPPDDCDDDNPLIASGFDEICDRLDNDCDQRTDEGALNACGRCGEVPREVCDGQDNDCDGSFDEDLPLNACDTCGEAPREVCDEVDNDCDGQTDEGTLNACDTCGDVPREVCDEEDNDCDGQVDEGTLNACDTCGDVPQEVCDEEDNDCDGRVDEDLALNACGVCGDLPDEICDAEDNDCDQQIDEDLTEPCFSLLHTIDTPRNTLEVGFKIHLVGDLNGDGVEDAVVKGRRVNNRIRLFALSGTGEILWQVNGDGDFAESITSGTYVGDEPLVVANDPENERLVFYNAQGLTFDVLDVDEGVVEGLTTLNDNGTEILVMGIPSYEQDNLPASGLIKALRFDDVTSLDNSTTIYSVTGGPDQEWGGRLYNVEDLTGDGTDDIIFTRVHYTSPQGDIGTQLMDGESGASSSVTLLTAQDNTNYSFATSLAYGRFALNSPLGFAYGSPFVSLPFEDNGAVYFLNATGNFDFFLGAPYYGVANQDEIGLSLATLLRPTQAADVLLIGANSQIIYRDATTGAEGTLAIPLPDLYVGPGLAATRTPQSDGTYRVWVSGISERRGNSKIWIYSAR